MLETERTRIRPLRDAYVKDLEQLFCTNSTVMNTTLKGRVFDPAEFAEILKTSFVTSENEHIGFWCITSKTTNQFIGITGILKCNYLDKDSHEFGFILTEDNWGKGLATEIGQFWIDYAKTQMHLTELIATASPANRSSMHVLEKLGMKVIGQVVSEERGERMVFGVDV